MRANRGIGSGSALELSTTKPDRVESDVEAGLEITRPSASLANGIQPVTLSSVEAYQSLIDH